MYLLARRFVSAVVGGPRGGAGRRDPVVRLGRDRDDREPLVPDHRVGALRDRDRARAADRPSPVRGPRRRSPPRFFTRSQFGILYVTWVGAPRVLCGCSRPRRGRGRAADLVRFWPTALPVVLGALAFVARARLRQLGRRDTFGAYWELWRGYDPFAVGKWFVYHLGDFAVYLVIVPVAVVPIVLWELGRAGRAGSRRAAAFVSLFAAANVSGLLVVAAFTSTPVGLRPAPRPLRLLPRAAVARRPRRGGSPPAFRGLASRPRSARSPRWRWR